MTTPFNFYQPATYNNETKFQLWTTMLVDHHDTWCSCCRPIAHLLSGLFPPDHKDYNLPISAIISREYHNPPWPFGGKEERDGGEADIDHFTKEKEEHTEEKEDLEGARIEELIAAAEEAEKR